MVGKLLRLLLFHPYSLPLNVPYDIGTLTEPLARVVHAANRANLQPSTSVAVIGSGLSALLMCAYASSIGCYPVCIISADQSRMNIATLNNWASHEYLDAALPKATPQGVQLPPENRSPQNRKLMAYKLLTELRVMSGYGTVFETTGSEPGGQLSMFVSIVRLCVRSFKCSRKLLQHHYQLAERAGKIVFTNGRSKPPQLLPLSETIVREIDTVSVRKTHINDNIHILTCTNTSSVFRICWCIPRCSPAPLIWIARQFRSTPLAQGTLRKGRIWICMANRKPRCS
jgi:threonine dehydrogenase-like Zn-dependent dehydrogenase